LPDPWIRYANIARYHDCANAVGAAIAKISGQIDVVKVLEGVDEEKVVEEVCTEAKNLAVASGADPGSVSIVAIENMPLQYVQMRASRIVVRAVSSYHASCVVILITACEGRHTEPESTFAIHSS
jgi:hypothetical protein